MTTRDCKRFHYAWVVLGGAARASGFPAPSATSVVAPAAGV
jgi:hypothetical protein